MSRGVPWRRPIASLNYLLTSHVWHQGRNGLTHQNPDSSESGIHQPCLEQETRNCPCLSSAGRQHPTGCNRWVPTKPQSHKCHYGRKSTNGSISIPRSRRPVLDSACGTGLATSRDRNPISYAGDVPTIESLAAIDYLFQWLPDLRIRFRKCD